MTKEEKSNEKKEALTCFAFLAALMTMAAESEAATAMDARRDNTLKVVRKITSVKEDMVKVEELRQHKQ